MKRIWVFFFCYCLILTPLLSFKATAQQVMPILGTPGTSSAQVIAVVNTFYAQAAASTATTTAHTTTSGNLLVVVVGNTSTISGCSDLATSPSNTFTAVGTAFNQNAHRSQIFYAKNINGATNDTITCTGGSATLSIAAYEISGCSTVSPLDTGSVLNAGFTPATGNYTSTTWTTANAIEIGIYGVAGTTVNTWSAGAMGSIGTATLVCSSSSCGSGSPGLGTEYGIFSTTQTGQTAKISLTSGNSLASYAFAGFH